MAKEDFFNDSLDSSGQRGILAIWVGWFRTTISYWCAQRKSCAAATFHVRGEYRARKLRCTKRRKLIVGNGSFDALVSSPTAQSGTREYQLCYYVACRVLLIGRC